ncbi:GNAT family N-acetyltransferase [Streptomyces rubiginosohelvolus]|uniref:GNAT family N-acetyltransferase n=1 Tax=Streptomyces rubiginosohelvolus TaxID=67362 RepID=UPI00371D6729
MPPADDTTYEIRTATPEDTGLVEALDGSFTTATVFHVETAENGFTLREIPVDPPLTKVFPDDEDENDENDEGSGTEGDQGPQGAPTFLALAPDGSLAGFVSVAYARWNRRLTIEDIEVAPGHRGRGVGRALMSRAEEFARERGAGHIWLEVTNINASAIHAYRRMGFALCGLDTSLYEFTASAGEYALYLSKPCRAANRD